MLLSNLALLGLLVAAAPAPADESLLVVRYDLLEAEHPIELRVHADPGAMATDLGPALASDSTFMKAGGAKPIGFAFGADYDGNGKDEIVTLQLRTGKKGGQLRLRVHGPPKSPGGDTGPLLASSYKKSLGPATGPHRVVAAGALDLEGDGKDEIFVVREDEFGQQSLEIRAFPNKKNKKMPKPIASDPTFGAFGADDNVLACGADVDGDGRHEIVVVRRAFTQPDSLLVFTPPQDLDGDTGDPIASVVDVTASDGATLVGLGRCDANGDGHDELVLLRAKAFAGLRIEVVAAPTGLDGAFGTPTVTVDPFVALGEPTGILAVTGLEGFVPPPPPPPPANLAGTYFAEYSHVVNGVNEALPLFGPLNGAQGGNVFTLLLPTFHPLQGSYDQALAAVAFPGSAVTLDVLATGSSYDLVYGPATVFFEGNHLVLQGSYAGKKFPPGGGMLAVTSGTYRFVRN